MSDLLKLIGQYGLVPAIALDDADTAVPVAKALVAGGLPVAEITFRTACAAECIRRIAKEVPEVILGAGTVLTVEQAKQAVDCGAKYIVAPGFNPKVVKWCIDNKIPVIPGISGTAEIEAALEMGLTAVKFFPAEQMGGIASLKAFAGPYTQMKFLPTGGVSEKNIADYLALPNVLACGGSFVIDKAAIKEGNYAKITELTKSAVKAILGYQIAHVGLYTKDDAQTESVKAFLSMAFDLPQTKGFVGTEFEVMTPYLAEKGHVAIATNSTERGVRYMTDKGIKFNPDGMKYNDKGKLNAAYLDIDLNGFTLHLLQKKF